MWLVVFVFWHDRRLSEIYLHQRPDDCTFFFSRNLINEGRNPPKNIAYNFHFSKYEIWWHSRTPDCFGGSTKHKTQHTRTQQPTRWAMPPYPPAALPPLSPWIEQWHHQIMAPPLPNATRRLQAIGVALAVVGLLAWGGENKRHQIIERGGVPWP